MALYDQETVRNNGQTSFSRLKASVKLHIDQMMRTRNFSVRNEVVERGLVTKSSKGKKAHVERKVGECSVEGIWTMVKKKTPSIVQIILSPLFFDFLLGFSSASTCLKKHFLPFMHPVSDL